MQIRSQIETAVRILGSQSKLADAVGCSQQQISYLLRAKTITAEMAKAIDTATGGRVSKSALRPDIFDHTSAYVGADPTVQAHTFDKVNSPSRKRRAS